MRVLRFVDGWLDRIAGWMIVTILSVMIVMAFGQVVLRNIFHSSIEWGDILLRHLVLWVGYFGAVIAAGEGRHLKIEFVSKLVGPNVRKIFFVVTNIFAAVICYYLFRAAVSFLQLEIESQTVLILDLPSWYFIVIIPAGYAIVAFRFITTAIENIFEISQGNWTMKEHF